MTQPTGDRDASALTTDGAARWSTEPKHAGIWNTSKYVTTSGEKMGGKSEKKKN